MVKLPRNEEKKIVSTYNLILMPLQALVPVLVKLDFLNSKMTKEAVPLVKQSKINVQEVLYEKYNNRILYDVLVRFSNIILNFEFYLKSTIIKDN